MEEKSGLTRTLARFISTTRDLVIPRESYEQTKIAFLDWLGVLLAGKEEPLVNKLIHQSDLLGGNPQATVLGHGLKKNVSQAALINGAMSHALDYDDTMTRFLGHPSVTLFPALLALSEWQEKAGMDFLRAYIIGLKVGGVIGTCAGFPHYAAGWHGTSTIGRLASAAACARLLGLDELQTVYALGLAGTQAAGLKRVFGTMAKPYQAGKAAQVGLESALMGEDHFTCAEDILEGPDGFFRLFQGQENEEAVASLGKSWETGELVPKYHASCHGTHSAIEGALKIVERERIPVGEIKAITIRTSPGAISIAGKQFPKTGLEGKFSISYCVANALLRGETGMQAFTDAKVNDPIVRRMMDNISVIADDTVGGLAARVLLETRNQETFQEFSDVLNEIPPLERKRAKVQSKFVDLAAPVLGEGPAQDLMASILELEEEKNLRSFIEGHQGL
jgi:2-methylcitrate dehydratase PrpD